MMLKYPKFLVFFLALFSASFLFAQSEGTLQQVQTLNKNKQYSESLSLLNDYRLKNKNEIYGDWLYAHTLHLIGQFSKSQRQYYALETKHPYNYDIKLDRINKVVENGRIDKAISQLRKVEHQLPKDYNFLAHKLLAQLFYWKGDYDESFQEIEKALNIYNDEQSALQLKEKIIRARSSWANISLGIFNDDQPLNIIMPELEAGYYINSMTTIGAKLFYPIYSFSENSYTTPWLSLFTQLHFIDSKIGIKASVGVIGYKSKDKALTGLIQIKKQVSKFSSIDIGVELAPYIATTFTIPSKLMQTQYSINYNYNNPQGFIGKASYSTNQFSALDNSFYTVSGWAVSPPFHISSLELRGGYGVNFSDSKQNTFAATESLDTILTNWTPTYTIQGTYNPFFSPNNQLIHSAIGMIKYNLNKDVNLGVDINYGFSATTDAPYLFLDQNTNNETFIARKFEKTKYHPLDINTYVNYKLSDDTSLKAFYKFQRTSYYESNYIGLSTHLTF